MLSVSLNKTFPSFLLSQEAMKYIIVVVIVVGFLFREYLFSINCMYNLVYILTMSYLVPRSSTGNVSGLTGASCDLGAPCDPGTLCDPGAVSPVLVWCPQNVLLSTICFQTMPRVILSESVRSTTTDNRKWQKYTLI